MNGRAAIILLLCVACTAVRYDHLVKNWMTESGCTDWEYYNGECDCDKYKDPWCPGKPKPDLKIMSDCSSIKKSTDREILSSGASSLDINKILISFNACPSWCRRFNVKIERKFDEQTLFKEAPCDLVERYKHMKMNSIKLRNTTDAKQNKFETTIKICPGDPIQTILYETANSLDPWQKIFLSIEYLEDLPLDLIMCSETTVSYYKMYDVKQMKYGKKVELF